MHSDLEGFPRKKHSAICQFAIVRVHGVGWCHISWPQALPSFWHVQSVRNPSIPCPLWKVHERSAEVFVEWGPRSENLRISILKGSYKCLEMMVKGLVVGSLNTNWRANETEGVRRAACCFLMRKLSSSYCIWMGFTDVIQLKKLHEMVEVLDDAVLGSWKRYPDLKLLETATCWTMSACTFVARIPICYSEDAGFFSFSPSSYHYGKRNRSCISLYQQMVKTTIGGRNPAPEISKTLCRFNANEMINMA